MTLHQLLDVMEEDELKQLLQSFESIPRQENGKANDVEYFLHEKAIQLEKISVSRTYLVFEKAGHLVGYFSLASKPLSMSKKNVSGLSNSFKKKMKQHGYLTDSGAIQVYSYLLGQLGRNFANEHTIAGKDLLTLAYHKLKEASQIVGAKYVWLECENNDKLIDFYSTFGFKLVEGFTSKNNLKVMIMNL